MNKILITGGAGFIGSNLCKELLKDNNNFVICLDNLYTGSKNNIKKFLNKSNFRFIKCDITDNELLMKLEKQDVLNNINYIYNCACPASPIHYQGKHAINTTLTCVLGIKNMLDLANKYNAKIMQFSTSEVYGEADCEYQNESYRGNVNCTGIRSCYDEGKRCAESLCFDYNRIYGTKIKVIRIFNTFGPNMRKDDGRVISNFICQALTNEDITIYGDGSQTRSFCYIDDLISGIIKVMNTDDSFIGPINLGNPVECSIKNIAMLVCKYIETKSKIIYKELPQDDPTHRKPDISLAKLLGWEPHINLFDGIENTIKYFRSLL